VNIYQKLQILIFLCIPLVLIFPAHSQNQDAPAVSQEQKDLDFADGLYQRGMYESAAQQYMEFIRRYPAGANRGIALFRQGESLYQLSLSLNKTNPVQAKVQLLKARIVFSDLIKAFPTGERIHDALLRHGELSYKLDDARSGLESLLRVIKESKDNTLLEAALFYAGRSYETEGKSAEAEQKYRQIRDTYPKGEFAAFSTYLLAELLAKNGKTENAVNLLNDLWKNPEKYGQQQGAALLDEVQLRCAQLLYNLDRFSEAAQIYQNFVQTHPSGENIAKAKYGAAWAEYRQGNDAKALEIAGTLQKQSLPEDLAAGIVFLQGTCAYRQQLYDQAIRFFREIIADPNAGDYRDRSWYQLAWAYYLSNQYDLAIRECQNLLRQTLPASLSGNLHFLLGQTYARLKQYEDAVNELRIVRQLDPQGEYAEESLYLMADLLYRLEQFQESGRMFEQFYETYRTSKRAKEALSWACNAFFADKDFPRAIQTADLLLTTFSDFENKEETVYRKALALYQLKEYEKALAAFDDLLRFPEKTSKKSEALYWMAYIHELKSDHKTASSTYGRLLKEFPKFENRNDVILRKALCDYHEKDFAAAFQGFITLLDTETASKLPAEVLFWMVFFAEEQNNREQALRITDRIFSLSDRPSVRERAYVAKGNQLVSLKRWEDAITNADHFFTTFPESKFKAEIFWSKAKSLEGLGQKEKSLECYDKSLAEYQKIGSPDAPFEATLYVDRGRLLESLNRPEEALESFLRVAIIYDHPELTPEAMYRGIRCHLAVNEKNEALILYQELKQRYTDSTWNQKAKEEFSAIMDQEE